MNNSVSNFPTVKNGYIVLILTLLVVLGMQFLIVRLEPHLRVLLIEIVIIIPALIYVKVRGINFFSIFRLNRITVFTFLIALVIGCGLGVLIDQMNRLLLNLVPMDELILHKLRESISAESIKEFIIIFITAAVIGPVAEESLFRGFFQKILESVNGKRKAVIITAFIFAAFHFNPWTFIQIFLLGLLLGVIAWSTGSIFTSIAAHTGFNLMTLSIVNIGKQKINWYLTGDYVSPVWLIISLALIFFGMRNLLRRSGQT